jgi:hypothetical protein
MSDASIIPPEVEALRGMEFNWVCNEDIGRAASRMYALALNYMEPLCYDQEQAKNDKYGGVVLPATLICDTFQFRSWELNEFGQPDDWLDVPVGRALRASNEYEFFMPARPEDILHVHFKVTDIVGREGKSGPLAFVTFTYEYKNQHGDLLARQRETMVSLLSVTEKV